MRTSPTVFLVPPRQLEGIVTWKRCSWPRTRLGLSVSSPERSFSISPSCWSWRPRSKSVVSENDGKREGEVGETSFEGNVHKTKLSLWTSPHGEWVHLTKNGMVEWPSCLLLNSLANSVWQRLPQENVARVVQLRFCCSVTIPTCRHLGATHVQFWCQGSPRGMKCVVSCVDEKNMDLGKPSPKEVMMARMITS